LARINLAFLFAQMSYTNRKSIIMSGATSLKQTGSNMNETSPPKTTVTIKKYANRRLYNTATSSYVTLESLAVMVKEGVEFNVYDAKTSEDITRSVLTQIIVEEEGKSGQQNLLPISFLRQLIGFYGDNMQWVVPKYLEHSMQMLANNQEQLGNYFQTAFGNMFPFGATLEELSKQNLAMFENALRLFSPFGGAAESPSDAAESSSPAYEASACCAVMEKEAPAAATVTSITRHAEPEVEPSGKPIEDAMPAPTPTPMPNVKSAAASSVPSADDMQQKIANLQRQLADLAKNRA
jgi:polyhydroxyalkanoate synthesis repressor PhaR